jgi:Tfp pilus assembly protein PilX
MLGWNFQQGNVLLVCLALMMIMTIWGITSTRNSSFSLQTNQNARFKQVSFEAAEFTLRQVENLIRTEVTSVDRIPALYDGTAGRYSMVIGAMPVFVDIEMPPKLFDYRNAQHWLKADWAVEGNFNRFSFIEVEYDNDPSSATYLERQPRAIIEYMGRDMYNEQNSRQPQGRHVFRISAIGWGPQGISSTVLRSHIALAI